MKLYEGSVVVQVLTVTPLANEIKFRQRRGVDQQQSSYESVPATAMNAVSFNYIIYPGY